tara:strand:- start:1707 stop:3095 length:1389 start_codon:yes stop_codon:yes gene_type:complete
MIDGVDNPAPHKQTVPRALSSCDKLVLVMVGLPGRGKTFLANKLERYCKFFHNTDCKVFTVGHYRRERHGHFQPASFFDPAGPGAAARKLCSAAAMDDLKAWLNDEAPGHERGRIAVFDSSNTTRKRRRWILAQLEGCVQLKHHIIFVERKLEDPALIEEMIRDVDANIMAGRTSDYVDIGVEEAKVDFRARMEQYSKNYEPLGLCDDTDVAWIQSIDGGRGMKANNIRGFLPGRIMQNVNDLHSTRRNIYLSRHGQSEYNVLAKIGGDSALSAQGREYGVKLGEFASSVILREDAHARLWTSTLKRTIETGSYISHDRREDGWVTMRPKTWRGLDELYAGRFDGMTYAEIREAAPTEMEAREKYKLSYRYPRGESYLDVIERVAPVIHALEQSTAPVLVIAHQGILRIIYAYFKNIPREEAPFLKIPLHQVIRLTPEAYECQEKVFPLMESEGVDAHAPSC